ncbi:MAG: hypothetical protein HYV09_37125 [Deltaproteobacteria bacterium]|nr:hypothetical protein [Deltaproteobacteria bacterium]
MTRPQASFAAFVLASAAVAACERDAPPEQPAMLFDSRVPLDPELERLKKVGDDPSRALHPASAVDLARLLEPGKRYEFVVMPNGAMNVAPKSVEAAANFWTHPILANGGAVKSAGHLRIERSGDALAKVTIDAESTTYCPLPESVRASIAALVAMNVKSDVIRVEGRTADCWKGVGPGASAAPAALATGARGYGPIMLEVARRFEVLGRAHAAGRGDLALYELEELEESFADDLPHARLPPLPEGAQLGPFIDAMNKAQVPELRKALQGKDPKAIAASFEAMAGVCNGCHTASGRAFIEVPTVPGEGVPKLDPKPDAKVDPKGDAGPAPKK